jgi:hypothetical protein
MFLDVLGCSWIFLSEFTPKGGFGILKFARTAEKVIRRLVGLLMRNSTLSVEREMDMEMMRLTKKTRSD